MEKFTDYIVLNEFSDSISETCSELSIKVRQHIEKGWVPQGGVSISISKHGFDDFYTVAQAMVKVEEV